MMRSHSQGETRVHSGELRSVVVGATTTSARAAARGRGETGWGGPAMPKARVRVPTSPQCPRCPPTAQVADWLQQQ